MSEQAFSGDLTRESRNLQADRFKASFSQDGIDKRVANLGEIPNNWSWTSIGQIARVTGGLTKNSKRSDLPHCVPYLRVANVYANELRLDDVAQIGCTEAEFAKTLLHVGDLLIVEGNGSIDQIGRVAIWKGEIERCSHQNHLIRVQPAPGILPEFVLFWLLSPAGRIAIEQVASSSAGLHTLSISKVEGLPIPICSIDEQRRLVGKLDGLFARTKATRAELARVSGLVERAKQAVLEQAFSGELTREWRERNNSASDWTQRTVGRIIHSVVAGKNLRCEERPPAHNERGVLKVSAVTWGAFDPSAAKTLPVDFEPPERTRVSVGDFLISRANTLELVGAVVIVEETPPNLFLSDKILRLEMADEHKPWLLWFLRSPKGRAAIEQRATGNQLSMRNLSQEALSAIEVPWPGSGIMVTGIRLEMGGYHDSATLPQMWEHHYR